MSMMHYLKDRRIIIFIVILVGLLILDLYYGIHFGIEFSGGTQIPITLEHAVNTTTMTALIANLQQRVSTFGLKQVTVEGIGNSEVYVIVPSVTSSDINQTISLIDSQGNFVGVVNGKEALSGSDILKGSVGSVTPQIQNGSVSWAVTFFITQSAIQKFAKAVFGASNQPLYMFLDRPSNSIIIINNSLLTNASFGLSSVQALQIMQQSLNEGNQTIPIVTITNNNASRAKVENYFNTNKKYTTAFVSLGTSNQIINYLISKNVTVKLETPSNMSPQYTAINSTSVGIDSWSMVGLLSAPILNPAITNGSVGDNYEITGFAPTTLTTNAKYTYAINQEKTITSVLNGGALPVSVTSGVPTTVPPTLGKEALYVSLIAGILAVIGISVFITLRYRKLFLILPILLTTLAELFIIVSIIGLIGTIDLAAVAGMIGVVGTGVDAQIIITDEILSKSAGSEGGSHGLLGRAFYIVWADAILLIVAMMPLFFATSLVTVIGFSESTIIGALLGVLVTRPVYGLLVSRHFGE